MERNDATLTIRLPAAMLGELTRRAELRLITPSHYARALLGKGLQAERDDERRPPLRRRGVRDDAA